MDDDDDDDTFNIFYPVTTPLPRRQRPRSSSLSNVPVLHITTTSAIPAAANPYSPQPQPTPELKHPLHLSKAQSELTKLLVHQLSRLKLRPQPPSVFVPLRTASAQKSLPKFTTVVDSVRAVVRLRSHVHSEYETYSADHDDYSIAPGFSTEIAYDYLVQLRDLLNISEIQGMPIFDAESTVTSRGRATIRRVKNSPQRPRSLSASASDHPHRIEILHECIEILCTIISEDARFKNLSFRPTRPPYGLQTVVLDIAHVLIRACRHDPATLSRIGFALIPAFHSFESVLHPRLFQFFESGIIRYMLDELHVWRRMEPVVKSPVRHESGFGLQHQHSTQMHTSDSLQVPSSNQGWGQHFSPSPTTPTTSSLSATAPSQLLIVYQLSSLVPPLLAALLQAVDPSADEKDHIKLYRFYSLLHTIISLKEDAYLDVLEVIAYNDYPTRYRALSVLATYWPRAVGHAIFGKELPVLSYRDTVLSQNPKTSLQSPPMRGSQDYFHEFVPWRFDSSSSQSCHVCGGAMIGFALLCPFCFVFVHFNCYDSPDGTHVGQYTVSSPHINSTAPEEPQLCFFSFSHILPLHRNVDPKIVKSGQHIFKIVNLFTLSLCMVCREPLWGHVRQGLKCTRCHGFVHSSCVQNSTSTPCTDKSVDQRLAPTVVEFSILERTFLDFYKPILFSSKLLEGKQYEEVSIYYSILSAQLHILDNGINCKSIVIQENKRFTLSSTRSFALHGYCRSYAEYLSSPGKSTLSNAMQEYARFNNLSLDEARCILFDWTFLAGITSVLKTPLPHHPTSGSTVNSLSPFHDGPQKEKELYPEAASHPYELAGLSHLRNVLSYEFHIHADAAVEYMLNHIRQIGFFEPVNEQKELFGGYNGQDPLCSFSLPLGLDLSTGVETLVVAIEACLEDIDVTVNEYGFLLLVRRFPPTGAASDYALSRLTRILFLWIISEDERLIILARDYIGRGLPGVRTSSEKQPWPLSASPSLSGSTLTTARSTATAANSVGEYLFCRRQLLNRHALPWLAAVYELDPAAYANFVFEFCVEIGERVDSVLVENVLFEKEDKISKTLEAASKSKRAEAAFRSVIKLTQAGALLSTFDQIIVRWLDLFASFESDNNVIAVKALSRLFHRDNELSRRSLSVPELNHSLQGGNGAAANDPWGVIINIMSAGLEGFERAARWLRVMAYSGVDIPDEHLQHVLEFAVQFSAPMTLFVLCLESVLISSWSKPLGGEGLTNRLTHVCEIWNDRIMDDMINGTHLDMTADFIRYVLVVHLLWYGFSREVIEGTGLFSTDIIPQISQQRRRVYSRYPSENRIFTADHTFINFLTRIAVRGSENICIIIAKFFSTLVSDSSHIESQDIDNFILKNGKALAQCAWRFYGLESPEASALRISFFLRVLVVESQPLEYLVKTELRLDEKWQIRFQAATRLFRVLLDVNSPAFGIAGRQWGLCVSDFFIQFFSSLWLDPAEEIRLAIDAWSRTLLPSHLHKISTCWDEYMIKAPIADSMKLASLLVQLHPHFPSWPVLSWKTITEVYNQTYEDEAAYGGTVELPIIDENLVSLRLSLIILSLQMLAEKIHISLDDIVQIKFMTARFVGFTSARRIPTPSGSLLYIELGEIDEVNDHAYGIIQPMLRLLDTSYKFRLPASLLGYWNQESEEGLLGNLFVDIIIKIWSHPRVVQRLSYVPLRGLLESMLVIMVKHDLSRPILKHLDESICVSIKAITDFILVNFNYDIQQLCFAVLSTFLQTYPILALRILPYQFSVLSRISTPPGEYLHIRTKEFIEAAFVQYEVAGLFWSLSKSGHMSIDFLRLLTSVSLKNTDQKREDIHDVVVRDTFSQISANITDPVVASALYNLEKYVTMSINHSYSDVIVQHFCLRFATIVRHINDTSLFGSKIYWDPKPLLTIAITIFERTDPPCFDVVEHIDILLRASLPKYDISTKVLSKIFDFMLEFERPDFILWTSRLSHTVLDVLSDGLKGKVRMPSLNLIAAIEIMKNIDVKRVAQFQLPTLVRLGIDAMSYFSLGRESQFTASDFQAYIAVAKLVLSVSDSFIVQAMSGDNRNPPSIRVWNLLLLASLEHSDINVAQKLFELLPTFSFLHTITLRFSNPGLQYDNSALDVNHAFASVKLWLLLARVCHKTTKLTRRNEESDMAERQVWNALWPPFERLLVQKPDTANGEIPPLLTFVRGCAADLILFVRQMHSVVASDTASHISILKTLHANESGVKFNRALRTMSEAPIETDFEMVRTQVANDVFTAEKLHAMDTSRQGVERRRENASASAIRTI